MSRPRLPVALAACVVALALVGCASAADDKGASGGDETSTTSSSTTTSTSTTSTTPTTVVPSQPTAFTATARDAVNELKAAWEAGDRARALAIAPSDLVDTLFFVPAGGFEVYGCDTGEFETSYCNYRRRSDEVYISVGAQRYPQGWQIVAVDPGD